MLCDIEEECTCGDNKYSSNYHSTILARASLTCQDPVEPQYYSTRVVNFPPVCSHCGGPEDNR